jgi:hypothetical protein
MTSTSNDADLDYRIMTLRARENPPRRFEAAVFIPVAQIGGALFQTMPAPASIYSRFKENVQR